MALKAGRGSPLAERNGSMRMMASRTRPWGKRAVNRLAAPWVAGVKVEGKKKKKRRYEDD